MSNKIVIFDPVCGLKTGHNIPTIEKYAHWLNTKYGCSIEAWIAIDHKSTDPVLTYRKMPWVYGYWLHGTLEAELKARRKVLKNDSLLDILKNSLHHIQAQRRIESSLKSAIDSASKYIFFPGADFYSLVALLSLAKQKKIGTEKIFIIRLMGVMESATKLPRSKEIFNQVLYDLKSVLGQKAIFTAETEKYAFELTGLLNSEVLVTSIPGPKISSLEKINRNDNPFIISCLGGARADKGYFEIQDLASKVHKIFNIQHGKNIKFSVQSMSPRNLDFSWEYQNQLAKSPNIVLVKPRLSDSELDFEISKSNLILLPYSQGTYASRGSAILFDTLVHGVPILGSDDTGFGDSIRTAGLGLTYQGNDDFVNRLSDIINLSSEKQLEISANQKIYYTKLINNLEGCFNE